MDGRDESLSTTPLPPSVESLLHQICLKQRQPSPDNVARRTLSQLGEDKSLEILNKISKSTIKKTLSGYIMFMANKYKNSPDAASAAASGGSPRVSIQESPRVSIQQSVFPSTRAFSINGTSSHSPLAKRQLFLPTSSSENPSPIRQRLHPQLVDPNETLNELEFRKAFLVRNYVGRARLEDVVSADDLRLWKDLPMRDFESEAWDKLGKRNSYLSDKIERRNYPNWDSGITHIYHCHVLQDGSYMFKGPFLSTTRTHLQRILGDENVLQVKLAEEALSFGDKISGSSNYSPAFNKIAEDGIVIGLRRYRFFGDYSYPSLLYEAIQSAYPFSYEKLVQICGRHAHSLEHHLLFFVFKDGGKEEKKKNPTSSSVKCFFVRTESLAHVDELRYYPLTNKTVWESRCLFMHAHMVSTMAKYMARFSLILSKTTKLQIDFSSVCVDVQQDIPCRDENGFIVCDEDGEPLIHTDGTGFISEDLALLTPKDLYGAKNKREENLERFLNVNCEKSVDPREPESCRKEAPLLMQIRLFHKGRAVKGTLLVNKRLSPRTIVIRPSMIKVQTDSKLSNLPTFNSLEIVRTSEKPKKAYLSKNLIALLSYGGVPNKFFLDLMESALKDAQTIYFDERTAFRVALNYGEMDENLVVSMITCNIPLNEPCLQSRLAVFANQERSGLKNLKLPVSETFYLMGTVDPTGRLERHQVCVILESGQVSGHVLVYRNPGLHFGDVHLFEATYVEELEHFVGNAKYGIFFSTKGPRSVGSELANGDFDGDVYWVSKNHELLKDFKVSEPWSRIYSTPCKPEKKKPNEMSADELEKELFNLFLRTRLQKSNCMGVAADSWIAFMDRLLILDESCVDEKNNMKRLMQELVDVYYDALDAPKSGKQVVIRDKLIVRKFPHYMEREPKFNSTSILGILYDMVQSYHYVDPATCGENIWKLPCFDFEIPPACMELWRERHNTYRSDMSAALRSPEKETNDVAADGVIQKYKKLLYDAPEFEDSPRNPEDIFNEAIAIYHVCYNRAIQMGDTKCCLFAWRVAGPALFKFYVDKQRERNQRPIICLPSVLRKLFA